MKNKNLFLFLFIVLQASGLSVTCLAPQSQNGEPLRNYDLSSITLHLENSVFVPEGVFQRTQSHLKEIESDPDCIYRGMKIAPEEVENILKYGIKRNFISRLLRYPLYFAKNFTDANIFNFAPAGRGYYKIPEKFVIGIFKIDKNQLFQNKLRISKEGYSEYFGDIHPQAISLYLLNPETGKYFQVYVKNDARAVFPGSLNRSA